LVRQRTELLNALRGLLCELGAVFPVGRTQTMRIEACIRSPDAELPALINPECQDLRMQISAQAARIEIRTKLLTSAAASSETARCLHSMPPLAHAGKRCRAANVGPMPALAVDASALDIADFRCGRDFAAWLGLVPRQYSSGGKERLGRVSKAGQMDIRCLLTIGAMSRVIGRGARNIIDESWLGRMTQRKPKMPAAIALANKMARRIWAMLVRHQDYRDPAMAMTA